MIYLKTVKKYCTNYTEIENYESAISSDITYDCHHRKEIEGGIIRSAKELIDSGLYYNRPASELIFLTKSEHRRLHASNKSRGERKKLSESKKGSKHHLWKGKVQCVETGKVYECAKHAERDLSICHVNRACKEGIRAGGFHWKYIGE